LDKSSTIWDTLPGVTAPATDAACQWAGWGTALKPAHEPICVARKPLGESTVASNVLQHGTGALNIDGCRVPTEDMLRTGTGGIPCRHDEKVPRQPATPAEQSALGRWPANLIHDGSDEVLAAFPDSTSTIDKSNHGGRAGTSSFAGNKQVERVQRGDAGSAARFFYCAKTSKKDRNEGISTEPVTTSDGRAVAADNAYQRGKTERANHHPTVKPTDLMRYLCRLVTPPGGTVLDPFLGSGSTGKAALLEDFQFIGIEREAEYAAIAVARLTHTEVKS